MTARELSRTAVLKALLGRECAVSAQLFIAGVRTEPDRLRAIRCSARNAASYGRSALTYLEAAIAAEEPIANPGKEPAMQHPRCVSFGLGIEVRPVAESRVGPSLGVYCDGKLYAACQSGSRQAPQIDGTTWRMACSDARYLRRRKLEGREEL